MKKQIAFFLVLTVLLVQAVTGATLPNLTDLPTITDDDLFYVVDNPGGTPADRKATAAAVATHVIGYNARLSALSSAGVYNGNDTAALTNIVYVETANIDIIGVVRGNNSASITNFTAAHFTDDVWLGASTLLTELTNKLTEISASAIYQGTNAYLAALANELQLNYGQAVPNVVHLGAQDTTATLAGTNSTYTVQFTDAAVTIALPASPDDGYWVLHYTNSYAGGDQVITVPSLIREEYDPDSAITSFTNSASAGSLGTVVFWASAGAFRSFGVVGDAWQPAGASDPAKMDVDGGHATNAVYLASALIKPTGATVSRAAAVGADNYITNAPAPWTTVSQETVTNVVINLAGAFPGISMNFKIYSGGTSNYIIFSNLVAGAQGTIEYWPETTNDHLNLSSDYRGYGEVSAALPTQVTNSALIGFKIGATAVDTNVIYGIGLR